MIKWCKGQRAGPLSAKSEGWIRPPLVGVKGDQEGAYCWRGGMSSGAYSCVPERDIPTARSACEL